ncbi:uncharacterized protein A4U43_C01F31240, partial [Asparagus officinalis]
CLPSRFTPLEFTSVFQKLKKLCITDLCTRDPEQIFAITSFLRSFSELQELIVEVNTYELEMVIQDRPKLWIRPEFNTQQTLQL